MTDPRSEYEGRADHAARDRAHWTSVADGIATRRGLVFLVAVGAWIGGRTLDGGSAVGLAVAALLAVYFIRLVSRHSRARRQVRWFEEIEAINREAIGRLDRDWENLPEPEVMAPRDHPYAVDLDAVGHASLLSLLGGGSTRPGLQRMRSWLLSPADRAEIEARQEAVKELTPAIDFREALAARARLSGEVSEEQLRTLLDWAEAPGWALGRSDITWVGRIMPVLTGVAIVAHVFGFAPYLWVPTLLVSGWFNRRIDPLVVRDFLRVSMGEQGLRRYSEIIDEASRGDFTSPLLRKLRDGLTEGTTPPPVALHRLFRLAELGEARRNMLHPVLNLLLHWDIHVVRAAERWKLRHGTDLRGWLDALGELDALSAVAGLAHAHPTWSYPEYVDEPVLEAEALGHPLIAPRECVTNDVRIGPPGTFLLVTGSNMSGKSTLLRAVGANVVLAGAGAPVHAVRMRLPEVEVRASMRFQDALEEGVSYFMAGLQRLKTVVEAARVASDRPVLYLLDEILQGTNTAERQIAARAVIRELLEHSAIGAVTTHDLSLADVPDLEERADAVHFVDLPGDEAEPIAFDYRLRPGIATSTNALKLMELMGLPAPKTDTEGGTPPDLPGGG